MPGLHNADEQVQILDQALTREWGQQLWRCAFPVGGPVCHGQARDLRAATPGSTGWARQPPRAHRGGPVEADPDPTLPSPGGMGNRIDPSIGCAGWHLPARLGGQGRRHTGLTRAVRIDAARGPGFARGEDDRETDQQEGSLCRPGPPGGTGAWGEQPRLGPHRPDRP